MREGCVGRRNHPVRRGKGGTAFGGERSEASNLPISLLIGGKRGCIPPDRREGRFTPTRSVARGTPSMV